MSHRAIGQERFGFSRPERRSCLDEICELVAWEPIAAMLGPLYPAAKGEPAWPPLAMFRALLLAVWYDLSDVKLAEALEDRTSVAGSAASRSARPRRSAPPSCASASASSRTGSIVGCSRR